MVQLNFNLILTCTILTYMFSIDFCMLLVCNSTHDQHDMPMHENNMGKFSKCEPCHKHKQQPQDVARHKPYLKALYNTYTLLLMDWMIIYGQFQHGNTKHGV